jgi:hypothetical protein
MEDFLCYCIAGVVHRIAYQMCQPKMLFMLYIKEEGLRTWRTHISSLRMCGIESIYSNYWKMSQGARLRAPSIGDLAASSKKSWSVLLSCYISYVLLARSIDLRWHGDFQTVDHRCMRGCHQRQGISLPCGCVTVNIIGRLVFRSWCCVLVDVIRT